MAIYKRSKGFELGTTENKSSKWPEQYQNPGPPDCESDALTTLPSVYDDDDDDDVDDDDGDDDDDDEEEEEEEQEEEDDEEEDEDDDVMKTTNSIKPCLRH